MHGGQKDASWMSQVGEDAGRLAEAVKIDLNSIFSGVHFHGVTELGLAGAQPLNLVGSLRQLIIG